MWRLSAKEREREKKSASPPCRRKSRWGWGRGEGPYTELWGGIKRKSRRRAVSGSQSWQPGSHFSFMCHNPLLPPGQACTPGLISQRDICRVEEQSPTPFSATGESSSGILSCPPSKTGENHSWVLEWDVVSVYFTPSCHKTPFPTPWVTEVLVIQKRNSNMGLGSARYRFLLKKQKVGVPGWHNG